MNGIEIGDQVTHPGIHGEKLNVHRLNEVVATLKSDTFHPVPLSKPSNTYVVLIVGLTKVETGISKQLTFF